MAFPIQFGAGSSQISKSSFAYLDVVAQLMQRNPGWQFVIEGHTDGVGSAQGNMILSWARAQSVYAQLIGRYGVDPDRVRPVGKGQSEPLAGTAPNNPRNRRVQFVLLR